MGYGTRRTSVQRSLTLAMAALAFCFVMPANSAVPHVFQPGELISAAKMNENFSALANTSAFGAAAFFDCEQQPEITIPSAPEGTGVLVVLERGTCYLDEAFFSGEGTFTFGALDRDAKLIVRGSFGTRQQTRLRVHTLQLSILGNLEMRRSGYLEIGEGARVEVAGNVDLMGTTLVINDGSTLKMTGDPATNYIGTNEVDVYVDRSRVEAGTMRWWDNASDLRIRDSGVEANISGGFGTRMMFHGTHWKGNIVQEDGYLYYGCQLNEYTSPLAIFNGLGCGQTSLNISAYRSQVTLNLPENQPGTIQLHWIMGKLKACGLTVSGSHWSSIEIWPIESESCSGPLSLDLQNSLISYEANNPAIQVQHLWTTDSTIQQLLNASP